MDGSVDGLYIFWSNCLHFLLTSCNL